jgi:hypothetical protein
MFQATGKQWGSFNSYRDNQGFHFISPATPPSIKNNDWRNLPGERKIESKT